MADQTTLVFLGTPQFSSAFLEKLAHDDRFRVLAVITQQDQPQGRKKMLTPPPVKITAKNLHLDVFQPAKLNKDLELIDKLQQLKPDFLLVIAYGQILNSKVLSIPKIKAINVHGSILPKYRGASPIEQALRNGDSKTGLSIMEMALEMDAGPVYTIIESPVADHDTNLILREKLAEMGSNQLPDILLAIKNGQLSPQPQNETEATYCHKITKQDGLINPSTQTATEIYNLWRAFLPWPGIYLHQNDKQLKLLKIQKSLDEKPKPGHFIIKNNQLFLGCQTGALEILEVQLEGKTPQSIQNFLSGNRHYFEIE